MFVWSAFPHRWPTITNICSSTCFATLGLATVCAEAHGKSSSVKTFPHQRFLLVNLIFSIEAVFYVSIQKRRRYISAHLVTSQRGLFSETVCPGTLFLTSGGGHKQVADLFYFSGVHLQIETTRVEPTTAEVNFHQR